MASKFKLHNSKDFHTFENISAQAFFFTGFDYPWSQQQNSVAVAIISKA